MRSGAGHNFSLCQQQNIKFRVVAAIMTKGSVGTLHAEMAHFHGSFQWSSLKGKNVIFGEVLRESFLLNILCILNCCLQNSVPGAP